MNYLLSVFYVAMLAMCLATIISWFYEECVLDIDWRRFTITLQASTWALWQMLAAIVVGATVGLLTWWLHQ